MPLLNTPDNIDRQLPVLLQRLLPMRRDLLRQRQIPRHAPDHHLPHRVIFLCIRIHILHPSQPRIRLIIMIKRAHSLDDIVAKLANLEFVA